MDYASVIDEQALMVRSGSPCRSILGGKSTLENGLLLPTVFDDRLSVRVLPFPTLLAIVSWHWTVVVHQLEPDVYTK